MNGRTRSSHYTSPSNTQSQIRKHTSCTQSYLNDMIVTSFQTAAYKTKVIGFDGLKLDVNGERSRTDGVVPQTSTIAEAPGRKLGQKGQSKYRLCVCVADIMTD
jgi:hypothetical protein